MAGSGNQKLKLLYLLRLLSGTDKEHPVTMQAILGELSLHGITAERKSIYDDLEVLREFGMRIVSTRGRFGSYYAEDAFGAAPGDDAAASGENVPAAPWPLGGEEVVLSCDEEAEKVLRALPEGLVREEAEGGKKKHKRFVITPEEGPALYGWLAGLGTHVQLREPESLIKNYRKYLKEIRGLY